jgi:hypothetical protein
VEDRVKYKKGVDMLTIYFMKQRTISIVLLLGALTLLLAACDSGNSSPAEKAVAPTSSTVNAANAIMKHSPSGTVEMTWDRASHLLTVRLALTGLYPKSVHPAFISSGSCRDAGKTVYPLSNVVADTIGFANTITKIKNVAKGIPESGWYVDVRSGPGMEKAAEAVPVSCADISNSTASTGSTATLNQASAPNQAASGLAELTVTDNRLAVTITMKGMAPNSKHAAHIHLGSCVSQGKIVYSLNPVTVNASGDGKSTTTIENVSAVPRSGWYINVHEGSRVDSSTVAQTDMDPIACGDFTPRI